jgi:hypothetical protein
MALTMRALEDVLTSGRLPVTLDKALGGGKE